MSCKIGTQCYIDSKGVDLENKIIPLILSDETKVVRFNFEDGIYDLILEHSAEAIDLSRKDILPVLLQHDTNMLPIGIHEDVRLEDKKLKSNARFDEEDELAMKVFKKASRGFMPSVSVGIAIHEKKLVDEVDGRKLFKATKWEITEASIVTVPANPNAKTGLSIEDSGKHNPTASEANADALEANATSDNNSNLNQGADMEFNREDLDGTEAQFKALVANRDTLISRNNTLELKLQTANTALATLQDEHTAQKAEMTGKVTEAEGKLSAMTEQYNDVETRLSEAIAMGVGADVALKMVQAPSAEDASKLALEAKESNGRSHQEDNGENPQKTSLTAWAEKHKGMIK